VSVGASRLPEPPRIDGSWSEWDTTQFPIPYLVFGRSDWSGEDDLRASYQVAWDADNPIWRPRSTMTDMFRMRRAQPLQRGQHRVAAIHKAGPVQRTAE
jgi:hypothetical protein